MSFSRPFGMCSPVSEDDDTDMQTVFFTLVRNPLQKRDAHLLVDSLRSFGGPMSRSTVWIFEACPDETHCSDFADDRTEVVPLAVPRKLEGYLFSEKVCACAEAETRADGAVDSLVWLAPDTLVVNPPTLYMLDGSHDVALRPVHIRNIGLLADDRVDAFWSKVYEVTEVSDVPQSVESFVDGQVIRPYFNTHSYSVNPAKGLFRAWKECFASLVCDSGFQAGPCSDELHQVFLHQAVLSALTVKMIPPGRLRTLPPEYSYPYNLHMSVPGHSRAEYLDDLVTVVYETLSVRPGDMTDIGVREPLKSWLSARKPPAAYSATTT